MEDYQQEIKRLIESSRDFIKSHVVLKSSNQHFNEWIDCQSIFRETSTAQRIMQQLSKPIINKGISPDVILGHGFHGYLMAGIMGMILDSDATYAQRDPYDARTKLYEFAEFNPGENVLLVDDGINQGSTLLELIELVQAREATVVGIAVLINRYKTDLTEDLFHVPMFWGYRHDGPVYRNENECELCNEMKTLQEEISKPGLSNNQRKRLEDRLAEISPRHLT